VAKRIAYECAAVHEELHHSNSNTTADTTNSCWFVSWGQQRRLGRLQLLLRLLGPAFVAKRQSNPGFAFYQNVAPTAM